MFALRAACCNLPSLALIRLSIGGRFTVHHCLALHPSLRPACLVQCAAVRCHLRARTATFPARLRMESSQAFSPARFTASTTSSSSPPPAAASEEELDHPYHHRSHDHRPLISRRGVDSTEDVDGYVDRPPSTLLQLASCLLLVILSFLVGVSSAYYLLSPRSIYPPLSCPLHVPITASSSPAAALSLSSNGVPGWSSGALADVDVQYDPAATNGAIAAAGAAFPLPGTKVSNFTVEAALPPSRWPRSIDRQSHQQAGIASVGASKDADTDPFISGSPARFQSAVRGAIVSLYTPNQHQQLMGRFEKNDELFYAPMASHTDIVIFYTVYPEDADALLHDDLLKLGCTELTNSSSLTSSNPQVSDIYARLRHPAIASLDELSSIREFVSPRGSHLITVPVAVNLPQHVVRDIGKLSRPDWMKCANKRWSMGYVLFSGAVFSSKLLLHPILRGYDYFVKMDLDIRFLQPIPAPSIFQSMHEQGCMWMHSQYSSRKEDCGLDGPEAVEAWAAEHQTVPASFGRKWWKSLDYFYGNFVGGWLGWVRSVENRQLATYLYENERHPGYFQHRWGDQPPFAKMLGMWFDIADGDVQGKYRMTVKKPMHSQVCDFSALRSVAFVHE